jgi:hypothetical protein
MTSMNERTIFLKALSIEPLSQREAYLDKACGGDASLRQGVAKLLQSHEEAAEQFLRPSHTTSGFERDVVPGATPRLDNPVGQTDTLAEGGKGKRTGIFYTFYRQAFFNRLESPCNDWAQAVEPARLSR